jgi:hypothetical protein
MSESAPSGRSTTRELSVKLAKELGLQEGECRTCGSRILWAISHTKEGTVTRVPLQPRAMNVYVIMKGPDGKPNGHAELRKGFESHFADCPHSRQHRKETT